MKDLIIYNTLDGRTSVALYAKDGNIWLNQSQIVNARKADEEVRLFSMTLIAYRNIFHIDND